MHHTPPPRGVAAFGGGSDAEFGRLEQRVYATEQGITVLGAQIERLGQHVDDQFANLGKVIADRSVTPWGTLIAAAGLLVSIMSALGVLAYMPIKASVEQLQTQIESIQGVVVSRTEHEREWSRNDKTLSAMLDLIQRNHAAIVPRGEHEEKWRSQTVKDADLQRQIDDVRRGFGETYSLRDAIKAMQERLDRVERGRGG